MKKILVGAIGAVALSLSAPASAADLAARPYTKAPPPVVAPIYDWSGFYIGANGGWGQSHSCVDFVTAAGTFATAAVIVPGALSAGKSGIAGKPISLCSDWKHKAIGPTSGTRASRVQSDALDHGKTDGIGLFTGQIGWAWNAALLYVKGGAAVTDNRFTIFDNPPGSVWSRQCDALGRHLGCRL